MAAPVVAGKGRSVAPALGLAVAVVLMALGIGVPAALDWNVHVFSFPPLHAEWEPRLGAGSLPAVTLAVLAIGYAGPAAQQLPWRALLGVSFWAASAWLVALATVDGWDGIGVILNQEYEYLDTAREVTNLAATLGEYVSRIPYSHPDDWPVHLAGHPAGALLFFVLLVRTGLGSGLEAGFVVLVIAATIPAAVLVTLRQLGAEEMARRAAPFLVLGPAAIWMAVSADAVFTAIAAWGVCCLSLAATRSR